jgi:diguanylate cyclase (GGDEF)-like protein
LREIQSSIRDVAVLQEATEMILSSVDLDTVLHHILLIVRNYFGISNCAVMLVDASSNELYVRAQNGYDQDTASTRRVKIGEQGVTGWAAQHKAPLYVPDVTREPRYLKAAEGIRSELALPLIVRDTVIGVLDIESTKPDYFKDDMIGLLALFASQAAVALENTRLHSTERRRMRQIEIIHLIARATTASSDLDQLLSTLADLLSDTFEGSEVGILLRGPDGTLELRSHSGTRNDWPGDYTPVASKGILAQAFEARMNVLVNDVKGRSDWAHALPGSGSELCVPLISFAETLGALIVVHPEANFFTVDDRSIAQAATDVCATAIRNVQLADELRRVSNTDSLTGVYNQRYFHIALGLETGRARRYRGTFSVLLVDLGGLRQINSAAGFDAGDMLLRNVAMIMKQQLRGVDVICRYSGDQFAMILPETSSQQAMTVIEKLCAQIQASPTAKVEGKSVVRVKSARATFPEDSDNEMELVRTLLSRLGEAKSESSSAGAS